MGSRAAYRPHACACVSLCDIKYVKDDIFNVSLVSAYIVMADIRLSTRPHQGPAEKSIVMSHVPFCYASSPSFWPIGAHRSFQCSAMHYAIFEFTADTFFDFAGDLLTGQCSDRIAADRSQSRSFLDHSHRSRAAAIQSIQLPAARLTR